MDFKHFSISSVHSNEEIISQESAERAIIENQPGHDLKFKQIRTDPFQGIHNSYWFTCTKCLVQFVAFADGVHITSLVRSEGTFTTTCNEMIMQKALS